MKELFLNVCEKHAPMKTKRTRDSKSPWITTFLKKRMNFRDRLKRKAIKTKDPLIWKQFRIVKNQVNREINSAKKAFYGNAFNNCWRDQRKTWKTINELTSRKSNKTVINETGYNGANSGDQTDVAEMQQIVDFKKVKKIFFFVSDMVISTGQVKKWEAFEGQCKEKREKGNKEQKRREFTLQLVPGKL